jgi:hypothetical protein
VTSLDWSSAWFDSSGDVVACKPPVIVPEFGEVWLTALELQPASSDAVFMMADEKQKSVVWSLDGATAKAAGADRFGRAVVPLGQLDPGIHTLQYGSTAGKLDQKVCFRPFLATR